jgi:hypothetical protein
MLSLEAALDGQAFGSRSMPQSHLQFPQSMTLVAITPDARLSPERFIQKWRSSTLNERAAAQSHFNDLCDLLGIEKPTDADPKGEWFCFEKGAIKTGGGDGWADVWRRGCFGWEYKGKRKDLRAAYAQLQQYAVALENPPLLIVSDMDRFVIHTNWTNTVSEQHVIPIEDLIRADVREKLRWAFTDPERLRPAKTIDALTREAADTFASLALSLRAAGHDPSTVAHFVQRLVFCMFAEDVGLLPRQIFAQILERAADNPGVSETLLSQLFQAMQTGGFFGLDQIEWFNGGLFDDATALPLGREDIARVNQAALLDWSDIDPSIFGTLFERGLDPAKRSQLGAHYTDAHKIGQIVQPVVIAPLLREWDAITTQMARPRISEKRRRQLFFGFLERLREFRVLDPACGSGNFLYVSLLSLKDLEHRVNLEAEALGLPRQFPAVGPECVLGLELNPYAAELARISVWIGEIQWMRKNGFDLSRQPVLRRLETIRCCDALLNSEGGERSWPPADAVVGNPPFLGGRKLKPELGDDYVAVLRKAYAGRVPEGADLVCYWFEKSRQQISAGKAARCGLVATNSISGGVNRSVLSSIEGELEIFAAWDDEPWTVDGASVRVAMVCFAGIGTEQQVSLNGANVDHVFADLTARVGNCGVDLSAASRLENNKALAFQGVVPRGEVNRAEKIAKNLPDASFLVPGDVAREMLVTGGNPNALKNGDVVRPYLIGDEITTRGLDRYIVDFAEMSMQQASLYEAPFKYIEPVRLHRAEMKQPEALKLWWRHWNSRPAMRSALKGLGRYIATPRVSKHRLYVWLSETVLPDCQLVAIASNQDHVLGVLHSRFHELWTLRMCTYLGVGNDPRYTPSTTFETFPFPNGLHPRDQASTLCEEVAAAARHLTKLRENWQGAADLSVVERAARTLTSLYNERPAWLAVAHEQLDRAVARAYGLDPDIGDDDALRFLLALNIARSGRGLM